MDDNKNEKNEKNEKEAKKQFFEELKSKNQEERKKLEELKQNENQEGVEAEEISNNESTKDDFSKKAEKAENKNVFKFFNEKLKASIIDTITTSVISIIALYLFDLILRLIFGYRIVDMKGMFIIIFIIVLVLYPFVMSKTKYKATLGQKFGE
ncbi:hypothetical protein ACSVC9_02455 [Clostridium sp. LBM24168]